MSWEEGGGTTPTAGEMTLKALEQRHNEVEKLKAIQNEMVKDFEEAMNLIVSYQRCLKILNSPDPLFVQARTLLRKYKMQGIEPVEGYKIFADGVDITLHPDSIQSTLVDDTPQIESGDGPKKFDPKKHEKKRDEIVAGDAPYRDDPDTIVGKIVTVHAEYIEESLDDCGQEKAKLVIDNETGKFHLRPVANKAAIQADIFASEKEPEDKVDESTREWLNEE